MKFSPILKLLSICSLLFLAACGSLASNAAAPTAAGPAAATAVVIVPTSTPVMTAAIETATPQLAAAAASATNTPAAPAATQTGQTPAAACVNPAALTVAETEGPYFKAGSPESSALASGLPGTKLALTGYVLTADCQPVAHALLDFWQANASGQYDNSGYTLRGHQYTDAAGKYTLETVVPGLYPGRTEHIHVKVQAPGGPILTTQLFFPGVVQNDSDGIFDASLLMKIQTTDAGWNGSYNFVIATK